MTGEHRRRAILWPALAVALVAAGAVVVRLAALEQDPAGRARLVVAHAGVAGFAATFVAFALARWLDRRGGRAFVAIAVALLVLVGLPAAMGGFYAIYDRLWLGRLGQDAIDRGWRGVLMSHGAAVYVFVSVGMRLLFPWAAPLAALLAGLIAWRQRR